MNTSLHLLTAAVLLLFLGACQDSKPLELQEGKIYNELHQNNIGKLIFMSDWIAFDDFSEEDFVDSLSIPASSDLGFRMFLATPLTHALHKLDPGQPVRQLCAKGNFQLSFMVDDQALYTYNLQPGAGSCDYKNSATVYGIPLVHKDNPDHWGRFLWTRFMKQEGGQEALSGGTHKLSIEVRPYLESDSLLVGPIQAKGQVFLTFTDESVDEARVQIQELRPTDKFERSDMEYDSSLIRQLNQKIASNYFRDITSIVVVKNGDLLIEQYYNGADRTTLHDTRSVGKSLASTLLGIAIAEGYIKSEDQKLGDFYSLDNYANPSAAKENISLKNLLTMRSGLEGSDMDPDSPGNEEKMYPNADWLAFGLDLPMDRNKIPGKSWDYLTAGAVILGDVIDKAVPGGLEKYAEEKLFDPLGITDYKWQYTPGGVPNTAGGFQMSSLENARYGQLYLDKGVYRDKEIIPASWVRSSFTKYTAVADQHSTHYGYLFWNKTFTSGKNDYELWYASGNGGNKVMVIEALDAVIVVTATAYGQPYMHMQVDEIVEDYLLPAIENK